MKVCYELTMPNNNAWNGKWTGADKKYYVIRSYIGESKNQIQQIFKPKKQYASFYYNFEDGWGADVTCTIVDAVEARKRIKLSKGFCGYEWMITEIETYGRILTRTERHEQRETNKSTEPHYKGVKVHVQG